ncbi:MULTISPECIES: hypothetical protein [Mesorhizobium]|uniref:Uncharacterized protein n=1 Tax=Mesorhizobium shonense TaxID=1209948 RepID=A0ABV2HJB2_9HYPH|nr:hypothetical protein [Mesorhizobium sp.]
MKQFTESGGTTSGIGESCRDARSHPQVEIGGFGISAALDVALRKCTQKKSG